MSLKKRKERSAEFGRRLCSFFILFIVYSAQGRILDFETTRLKSTGGTGVGALMLDEATILNPASLAFFGLGSLYFQKTNMDVSDRNGISASNQESGHSAIILSDTKGTIKGAAGYIKMQQEFKNRERFAFSSAMASGKKTAVGITVRATKDKSGMDETSVQKREYNQIIFGVTQVLSENFSLGMVLIDPFKEYVSDTRAVIGAQYDYDDFVFFLLDLGADYNETLSRTVLYRAALNIRMLENIFLRFGLYEDKGFHERGNGLGLSWVQPRLSFDFSFKNTILLFNSALQQQERQIKETSFSLSYRF